MKPYGKMMKQKVMPKLNILITAFALSITEYNNYPDTDNSRQIQQSELYWRTFI